MPSSGIVDSKLATCIVILSLFVLNTPSHILYQPHFVQYKSQALLRYTYVNII
jgi:hypothetical protein